MIDLSELIDLSIKGLQEAQRWNLRAIAATKPTGQFGVTIRDILTQLQRYEVSITHVDTGALKASERIEIMGLSGRIYIDPSAQNPRSGVRTAIYGETEDLRGGSHAFGARTEREGAPPIINLALVQLGRSLQ